ncbi:MAG: hypothetical protein EXS19_05475 [Pedosphaera sp.]|nr:hypothetical protein [Pedosphaera sp.]
MFRHLLTLLTLSASLVTAHAQQAGSPAAAAKPSAGVVNDWLRSQWTNASPWDVGAQIRLRYEVKENAGNATGAGASADFIKTGFNNDNVFWVTRTKVHVGYKPQSWLQFYVQGRDSRSTGDDRAVNSDSDQFELYQAYLQIGNPKEFPLSLKIGRQELSYGEERFIGKSDWGNTGRVFDAAKLRFEQGDYSLDGFVGRINGANDNNFNLAEDYEYFSGIYGTAKNLIPKMDTHLYFIARNAVGTTTVTGVTPPSDRDVYTIGARLASIPGQFGNWDFAAEFAGQFGTVGALDHTAYGAFLTAGYTWKESAWTPRLGIQYDWGSGDEDSTDGKSGTLDQLYGTNHGKYGYIDVIGLRNIHDPHLRFSAKPHKDLSVAADLHAYFLSDDRDSFYSESGTARGSNGYGRNSQFSKYLGSELDLVLSYSVNKWWTLQAGYAHFFTGSYIKSSVEAGGGIATDADWVYFQTIFNF